MEKAVARMALEKGEIDVAEYTIIMSIVLQHMTEDNN